MSTPTRIWTVDDAQQLTLLRETAGLDISIVAKRHSLSVHQVRQLEEGGDDRFYSQAIKLQVGRKLLRAFGGDLVDLPQEEVSIDQPAEAAPSVIPEPLHASAVVRDATQSTGLPRATGRWWLPMGGVALIAMAWFGWQQSMTQQPTLKKNISAVEPAPAARTEPDVAVSQASGTAQEDDDAESAAPSMLESDETTSGVSVPVATSSPECIFGQEPKRVSVFEPRRPGNYVYFEAQAPVYLCVRDAAQQVTTLELSAGRGRTVRGAAPFEVLSEHFAGMRIFYQGKLVAPGLLTEPHIVLRPQAIVEPVTEVN